MGQIADDIVNGLQCSWCGICFEKAHGYPVLCMSCYDNSNKEDRLHLSRAAEEEL